MFGRTTLFEIDTLRISLEEAERVFLQEVVPRIRQQPGYKGLYVMRTSEGKGVVLTLWESEEAAQSGIESGYYQEQLSRFVTFMRQPPGRDQYEVILAEAPSQQDPPA
jgi:heme-degrading monooxygenase HmoA